MGAATRSESGTAYSVCPAAGRCGRAGQAYPDSAAVLPVPQPVNIFMTVEHAPDGTLTLGESPTAAGDSITLRAVRDCVVVVSVCPQDLIPISRGGVTPLALEVEP